MIDDGVWGMGGRSWEATYKGLLTWARRLRWGVRRDVARDILWALALQLFISS